MSITLKILECAVDSLDWNDVVGTPALWWKDRPIAANIATSALFHSSGWNPINEGIVVNPLVVRYISDTDGWWHFITLCNFGNMSHQKV